MDERRRICLVVLAKDTTSGIAAVDFLKIHLACRAFPDGRRASGDPAENRLSLRNSTVTIGACLSIPTLKPSTLN